MINQNLHEVHLQEVGLVQIQADHVNCTVFGWELGAFTITWSQPLVCMWSGPKYYHV